MSARNVFGGRGNPIRKPVCPTCGKPVKSNVLCPTCARA